MEKITNFSVDSYLNPSKILESPEYADWVFNFSKRYRSFSDDPTYLYENISETDKINLKKLSIFASSLEYVCLVQNVRRYTYFLHESNSAMTSIYFIYKGRNFVITKSSSSVINCKVCVRSKMEICKHKYITLDKVFN